MSLAPYTNAIAHRMFVATADQNYALARLAYFNQFDLDFFWLSLHAIEKYLKAILLLNRHSAKGYGHNLRGLHSAVKKLYPKLVFGPLVDPKIKDLRWHDSSVGDFLVRLNEYGHASNRYLTYGYTVMLDDLMKVDQLVWSIRRHCRTLRDTFEIDGRAIEIDEVEALQQHRERWALDDFLPLERLIGGRNGEEPKRAFLRLNTPFAPNDDHLLSGWRFASSTSVFGDQFSFLQAPGASQETKATAASVLRWALANIDFVKKDKATINDVLAAYEASHSA